MSRPRPNLWAVSLALLSIGVAAAVASRCSPAAAQDTSSADKSWADSITSPFKKLGQAVTPKRTTTVSAAADDPVSLKSKSKADADLYVAVAQLYEQGGKLADAAQQYELALRDKPDHLPALLGYAQLKDRMEKPSEALELYQRASKVHPKEASAHNNLGLYYARHGQLDEAVAAMNRAIQLDPKNPLYRNNIAGVLVDQNRVREALAQLREAHAEAAAYYNLGYLLNKKGQTQAAMQQFRSALKADPSLESAQRWLEYLQRTTAQTQAPPRPMPTEAATNGPLVLTEPVTNGRPALPNR